MNNMQEINNILPLFKTHYSVGRSILTLEPESDKDEADSVFTICKEYGLTSITVLEDDIAGLMPLLRGCEKAKITVVFGLLFRVLAGENYHKIAVFARNSQGLKDLTKLYSISNAETKRKGFTTEELLAAHFTANLKLCIPFYDSYLYNNLTSFSNFTFEPSKYCTDYEYFIEDNDGPYDNAIGVEVIKSAAANNVLARKTKTILYKSHEDFDAYVTYKCACNRMASKERTLGNPNFDSLGSDSFCIEPLVPIKS